MARLSINVSEETKEALQEIAKAWDRDMSWVARKFIQEGIDRSFLPEEEQE